MQKEVVARLATQDSMQLAIRPDLTVIQSEVDTQVVNGIVMSLDLWVPIGATTYVAFMTELSPALCAISVVSLPRCSRK